MRGAAYLQNKKTEHNLKGERRFPPTPESVGFPRRSFMKNVDKINDLMAKTKGITQCDIGNLLGMSQANVSRLLSGRSRDFTAEDMVKLSVLFKTNIDGASETAKTLNIIRIRVNGSTYFVEDTNTNREIAKKLTAMQDYSTPRNMEYQVKTQLPLANISDTIVYRTQFER